MISLVLVVYSALSKKIYLQPFAKFCTSAPENNDPDTEMIPNPKMIPKLVPKWSPITFWNGMVS